MADYSRGRNERRRNKIKGFILNILHKTDFEDTREMGDVDRLIAELARKPEKYITPEPDDPFGEDLSRNLANVRKRLGIMGKAEQKEYQATMEDAAEGHVLKQVEREIERQIDEYGVEQVVDAAFAGEGPDELMDQVVEIHQEFGEEPYRELLDDYIKGLYKKIDEQIQVMDKDTLEQIIRAQSVSEQEVKQEIVNQFARSFGQQFDSIQDAIESLKERTQSTRTVAAKTASIRARGLRDEVRVSISDGNQFDQYESVAEKRVRNEIDLSNLRQGETRTVGMVTIRGDDLVEIDLTQGRKNLGALAEATPAPEETRGEGMEQIDIEQATAGQVADRFLEQAERSDTPDTAEGPLEDMPSGALQTLADGIAAGVVDDEKAESIGRLLEETPITLLTQYEDEKPVGSLVEAIQDQTDVTIFSIEIDGEFDDEEPPEMEDVPMPLTFEEQEASNKIQRLLASTRNRDERFYRRLAEVLESGRAKPGVPVDQSTLDILPEHELEDLAEQARDLQRQIAVEQAEITDFPGTMRALERGPGRSVANYWRPLESEFQENEDYDTLREQGVLEEEIERLQVASHIRDEFIQRIQDTIAEIQGSRTQDQSPTSQGETVSWSSLAEKVVPQNMERTDPITGETWTANPELETRFMEFVYEVKPNSWWDTFWFERKPSERKRSMKDWTRLQIRAGNATVRKAQEHNLPDEWLEGL